MQQDSEAPECVNVYSDHMDDFCEIMKEDEHEIRWSSEPLDEPEE